MAGGWPVASIGWQAHAHMCVGLAVPAPSGPHGMCQHSAGWSTLTLAGRQWPLSNPLPAILISACSVDESLVFDPTDLAEDVTPAAALKALGQVCTWIGARQHLPICSCGHAVRWRHSACECLD